MNENVLVTGVSTGIGRGVAVALTEAGYTVYGSVRSDEDARRLAAETEVKPLVFDVTDDTAVHRAVETLRDMLGDRGLSALVNNAGISQSSPLAETDVADLSLHFAVNVEGAHRVTRAFLPLLEIESNRRTGKHRTRIVNVSSMATTLAPPFSGPYVASKAALEVLSHVWRRELKPLGIDVIVLRPGSVRSPIWEKANVLERFPASRWRGPLENQFLLTARAVRGAYEPDVFGRKVVRLLRSRRPRTVVTISRDPLFARVLPRFIPPRVMDTAMARFLGLRGKWPAESQ